MKANELMIGDWVMYNHKPVHVDGMDYEGSVDVEGEYYYVSPDKISPIPLTEEILKTNGIKWSDEHCVFTDSHHLSFNREVDFGRVYNMDGDNHHEVIMPFRFVHELQHALRLCGLNDLADNFKLKADGKS